MYIFTRFVALIAVISLFFAGAFSVSASHSWGNYHWGRTVSPFTLKLGDNVSLNWDARLAAASTDWSVSEVLDTSVVTGTTTPRNCRARTGRVEVCNSKYGKNGWLGVASVWVSGSHIVQGTVKLNDTYFNTPKYNTLAWKQFVMCQEIGHTFGLNHQDEDFTNPNLGTCMDYTNDPSTNQQPNQHDYDQLSLIYSHLDSINTVSSSISSSRAKDEVTDDPDSWGRVLKKDKDGKNSLHEKDLGRGKKVYTFVIWDR
ncbi:MAG: hypothetical protein HY336_00885 [Candidatus Doudnabacteria bacterium]|nr:hypothetical protein [Candidatus Doudnabacteria bacterium]